ncbi:MAG TPA: ATP-binding cassette domain-containing protein [Vicinamibacterales bacterium]|nr:ATP-binding cassette domain-containing protein [Vicinamibacterales bacterium]
MVVIDAQGVSKQFLLRHNASVELKVRFLSLLHARHRESVEEFWALRNVSLEIHEGEALGLVGRNGSGKSTLLKLIAAIHRPTEGKLLVRRGVRISSMIELGVGFHGELTGRENVFLNAAIHGLTRSAIDSIYDAVVEYSGLEHFIDVPIKNYSSGMYMRLGFAIAANLDPDILLLDEIFAVGDADFQERCTATVRRFIDEGKTILFVSHAPAAIRSICRRVCVLDQGRLAFDGDVDQGLAFYADHVAHGHVTAPDVIEAPAIEARAAQAGIARWQFEFLLGQGLEPRHHVLDVGCGNLSAAVLLLPFLDRGHYWGVDRSAALVESGLQVSLPAAGLTGDPRHVFVNDAFDVSGGPRDFDFAFASSLFVRLPFNSVARCIASVVRRLGPSGRFYATWFENADADNFDPIPRPGGTTTYPDREPYHYTLGMIAAFCESIGAVVERVDASAHPGGESVFCIRSGSEGQSVPAMRTGARRSVGRQT